LNANKEDTREPSVSNDRSFNKIQKLTYKQNKQFCTIFKKSAAKSKILGLQRE
jgi:hypothetical protein